MQRRSFLKSIIGGAIAGVIGYACGRTTEGAIDYQWTPIMDDRVCPVQFGGVWRIKERLPDGTIVLVNDNDPMSK